MRIGYDKGAILEIKEENGKYTYALCLGIVLKDKTSISESLEDFVGYEDTFRQNLLFGSIKDVMERNFAFDKLPLSFTSFSSENQLSLEKVIKGFQKYPFFTYFFVRADNKVVNKKVETATQWTYLRLLSVGMKVLTYDSGIDLDFMYLKSCLSLNKKPYQLWSVKDYYDELKKQLKIFRETHYDNYLDDIYSEYKKYLYKNIGYVNADVYMDNRLFLVETENQYYLFDNLFNDLYIQIGKIDKRTSTKHDKAYFYTLLRPNNDFIEQERYKPVQNGFSRFLDRNKENIVQVSYYPYMILEDLNLRNSKLKLDEKSYQILETSYC